MSDTSRRKLLKSIAAGSGAIVAAKSLPESWSKPVVDSVMLPAHAQTSEVAPNVSLDNLTTIGIGADCLDVPAPLTSRTADALSFINNETVPITITSISVTSGWDAIALVSLPVVIPAGDTILLTARTQADTYICGTDTDNSGSYVFTLSFEGYLDFSVSRP